MTVSERMRQLRDLMKSERLDAYIIYSSDPHQSEYVAPGWQRRAFISGFDGSAGTVVVLNDKAGLWTDSRYFLQAEQQLAGSGIDLFKMGAPEVPSIEEHLAKVLPKGARVGLDFRTISISGHESLSKGLASSEIQVCSVAHDLVEQVWGHGRPAMPTEPVRIHPAAFAGQSVEDKVSQLRGKLAKEHAEVTVLASLDEIAWLLNLRGADIAYNPLFISFVIIDSRKVTLFICPGKVSASVRQALPPGTEIVPYEAFDESIIALGRNKQRVLLDPATISAHVLEVLTRAGAVVIKENNGLQAAKAVKNDSEIAGMCQAHLRDGVAMVRFLAWLDRVVGNLELTELSIVKKLEEFRREQEGYFGPSFASIVGFGAHGAIVHYSVTSESNATLSTPGLLLVDSGGQYGDGTTDITRTLALGHPTDEQISAYTTVLQGHLRLARTCFPKGTDGHRLEMAARLVLWDNGLDYGHGTGHGVGAALCVHEGPFSVSPRKNLTPLEKGHILSNEPGYYKTGEYGIRIENLVLVVNDAKRPDRGFLAFESLTLCPYEIRLIDRNRLTPEEREQVDGYHARVRELLSPRLDTESQKWLEHATRPL